MDLDKTTSFNIGRPVHLHSPTTALRNTQQTMSSEKKRQVSEISGGSSTGKNKNKKDGKTFTKLTQREHILHRPDMYRGSIAPQTGNHVIVTETGNVEHKDVEVAPAFLNVLEEALMNAADRVSCAHEGGNSTKYPTTKIAIDLSGNQFSVTNDGDGISCEFLEEHGIHAPELIFANLLTSSNYDDDAKRLNVGRNGLGVKILNIYSKKFTVETIDASAGKKYKQTFEDNMVTVKKPKITSFSGKPYTKVTAELDLERFGMRTDNISDDIVGIMRRRAHEVQVCSMDPIKVTFNGTSVKCPSPEKYMSMYGVDKSKMVFASTPRWKVAVAFTPENGEFRHHSFVNSTCTPDGGTHLGHVLDPLLKDMTETLRKKFKSPKLRSALVKECLTVVVSGHVFNPTFTSQTKSCLTLHARDFGSSFTPPDNFIPKLLRCGVADHIHELLRSKDVDKLKDNDGKKVSNIRGIPNLHDARFAGTKKSSTTYLMATEGASALTMALSAMSVIGRDRFGAFPLRGKLLNVRDAPPTQISSNAEITNLKKILGLKNGVVYENTSSLRYGGIILLCDQDSDGSHIRGLLLNMFEVFWPSLLKLGFVHTVYTPVVRATKGSTVRLFYNEHEYDVWKGSSSSRGFKIKYLKGLGSSTPAEAREYFKDIETSIVEYVKDKDSKESMSLAFSKDRSNDRKAWLGEYDSTSILDNNDRTVKISDFVNKELIHFSNNDVLRSIGSAVDGLKVSQRKALFGTILKGNFGDEVKVAQLTGFVSDKSRFHHGEVSMSGTIVSMAQDFVGSNNINLFLPKGQLGSRLQGGKDAASPRYTFVQMNPVTNLIFRRDDDPVISWTFDEGCRTEPVVYCPIIPMALVNSSIGIGTGFSTCIPGFNPKDVIENVRARLEKKPVKNLVPWYRGFKGTVQPDGAGNFVTRGVLFMAGKNVHVTELPVGTWTSNYKEMLDKMVSDGKIESYEEACTDDIVDFRVVLKETMDQAKVITLLKLSSVIRTSNLHLFDSSGRIKKYEDVSEIEREHFEFRLGVYIKRKEYQLRVLRHESLILSEKVRFFRAKIDGSLIMENRSYDQVIGTLKSMGFKPLGHAFDTVGKDASFDYVTNVKLFDVTSERVQKLIRDRDEMVTRMRILEKTSPEKIWENELNDLEKAI